MRSPRGRSARGALVLALVALVVAVLAVGPARVAAQTPDPLLLPQATTGQVPLTAPYNALNVPALAAGASYDDPTTGVTVYKITSSSFPTSSSNWGHDYSEGGNEISLPYRPDGVTRAVVVYSWGGPGHWLLDFTPGVGVSNPRALTGRMSPDSDLHFTFSSNPATPYYVYIGDGNGIRRFDIRTMTEAPGDGWPVPGETGSAWWFHQSENDGQFVWMRGPSGSAGIVAYEPSTGTKKVVTSSATNEPRIDRAGRYVGLALDTPNNGLSVWDVTTNTVTRWPSGGDPGLPFAHLASLRRRWVTTDWNLSFPLQFGVWRTDVFDSGVHIGGPALSGTVHGNGAWIQNPANLDDQWSLFTHYGSLRPSGSGFLAPGGMVLVQPSGGRRLLAHTYNSTSNYSFFAFAKFSPDGKYVMFTSNMNGASRADVFLAEMPVSGGGGGGNNPVPVLNTLSPSSANEGAAGFTLTATGSGFVAASVVQWNGSARPTTFVSSTQLRATISAADIATGGTAAVRVSSPAPGGGTSAALTFTITIPGNPVPTLSALSPGTTLMGGGGFTLTATGTGFVNGSTVQWNGAARTTTFVSATQLTAAIAAADIAAQGTASVTVFTGTPGGGTSAARTFNVNAPAPTLASLSPSSATAGGAAFTLTVTGDNFVPSSLVRWNGATRTTTYVSATQLRAAITAADIATGGTPSVTVFTPTPGGGTSTAQTFTTIGPNPAPSLSSLSPSSAGAGGSAFTLTVNGSNFVAASQVRWDGTARTTTFVSASQLTAAITAGDIASQGTASVTVFSPAPGGGTSAAQTFTVTVAAPTVSGLAPSSATVGDAAFTLTVNGGNFVSGSEVRWNGTARPTTFVSAARLTAAIPATAVASQGTASVTVFTPAPGGGTSAARTFTINAASPAISALAPSTVAAGSGAFTLTVTGSDFVAASTVRWNGAARTTTFVSDTRLTAAITAADVATAGTAQVTVVTPAPGGGTSAALSFSIAGADPAPTLSGLAPASILAGSGDFVLTVTGGSFVGTSQVRWNGAVRPTTYVNATRLTAAIGAADVAAAGTAQVTVVTPAPGGGTSAAQTFTMTASNPSPVASAIAPSSANEGGADFTLTVTGSGFVSGSTVQWNGAPRTTTLVSGTQLTAAIPASDIAASGTAQVVVVTPGPGGGTSAAKTFTINNPMPELAALAPDTVISGATDFTLAVSGDKFRTSSQVRWNGVARPTTYVSRRELRAAIKAADVASPGTVQITVTTPTPGGGTSTALGFTRLPATRLLSIRKLGSGNTRVTSTAPAMDCAAPCNVYIGTGTTVTLQASAPSGSVFNAWGGACTGTGNTCTVVMNTDQTVMVDATLLAVLSFSATGYSVTEAGPAATIAVTRTGGMHAGATVEVRTSDGTAHAGADYTAVARTLTFAAGQTSQTVTVPVSNGTLADGSKTVNLALLNPQGVAMLGARPTATLTIADNDVAGRIQFGAVMYTIAERADVPTTAMVRVTRTGGGASGVTVNLATSDDTARAGSDYTALATTLTFGAGELVKDVPVTILPDTLVEGDETLALTLSNPGGGAQLGVVSATHLMILDAQVGVQFGAPVYRAIERRGSATITVVRTGPTTGTTTVAYSTANGTAMAGVDYTATSGVLTFGPRVKSRSFTVPLLDDTVADGVKTVLLMLGAVTNGGLGPQSTAALTIYDNDGGGAMRFTTASYAVSERTALATITVIRTGGYASAVTVDYATSDGTATAGQDYVATSGRLTFAAGQASRTFTVPILPEALVEGAETIMLTLSNPTGGATLGTPAAAVLTIQNDDVAGAVRFSATGYRVSEGGLATITVLRSGGTAAGVTVSYATVDGTAVAGVDYTATSGTLTFGAGESSRTFTVQTALIAGAGRDRALTLALSGPGGGGALGKPAGALLTIEDTTASLELSAATYAVGEARGSVMVTVLRSGPTKTVVSVRYATSDGTAVAGQDYMAASGALTFASGVTARSFTIALKPDMVVDGDKTLVVTLSDPAGAEVGARSTAQVLISDDDGPGTLQLSAAAYQVGEGGTATITVLRTGGWGSAVSVPYTVTAGTATAGVDFVAGAGTLTFGPGVTSRTFTVATRGDSVVEGDETVSVTLGAPSGGATLGSPSTALLTIADNDLGGALRFWTGAVTVAEGKLVTVQVSRSGGAADGVTVQYAVTGGTAVAGVDYVPVAGTLTFAAGQMWGSFKVQALSDELAQGDRTLVLALSAPTGGATLGVPAATTLTIVDDEPKVRFGAATYKVTEAGLATVTVLRSGPSTGTVTVGYTLSYDSAGAADIDGPVSGTLTFGPRVTSRSFTVQTHPDTLAEGAETLRLTLSGPVGATLGTPSTTVLTIADNDVAGSLQWSAAAYSASERAGGVLVTITRTGGAASSVTVNYATSGGTAAAGLDYSLTTGTVTFGAGETTKSVWIPVLTDPGLEPVETLVVTLSNPTGQAALATPNTAMIFIVD